MDLFVRVPLAYFLRFAAGEGGGGSGGGGGGVESGGVSDMSGLDLCLGR